MSGWIGVDLDGTLAHYQGWNGGTIGDPIPLMLQRVKAWLADGREVRIFTARVSGFGRTAKEVSEARFEIEQWCRQHIGIVLAVTNEKDFGMIELWDDRCVRVRPNTGRPCCGEP